MKIKKSRGMLTLFIGTILLILSIIINKIINANDIYCIICMILSLVIEAEGFYKILKETY